MATLENKTNVTYINSEEENAHFIFANVFHSLLENHLETLRDIVILCIGTDRATGDSLGPLVGHKLIETMGEFDGIFVYGTLDSPVHAKNIGKTIQIIAENHNNPFIIAIDASLGKLENIGYITMGKGCIRPGAGLNKKLPNVGDVFITGIVNYNGAMDIFILQNTRLNLVMKMAYIVCKGITTSLTQWQNNTFQ